MTKIKKSDKIAVLKFARERIKSRADDFVCNAIGECYTHDAARNHLLNYIKIQLGNNYTLSGWREQHQDVIDYGFGDGGNAMRKVRLQWIDWMIANAT